tara:strand:+ start:46 stop:612 length:567 start_codon:yes stop_codon:yes gene_type:complete
MLTELAEYINNSKLKIKLYIETRAEGINEASIKILKKLKIDGVGMGIELSSENYRETQLNRFVNPGKISKAFKILKKNKINRTAYNIIGLPDQDEKSIIDTIKFNAEIKPDVSSVAYYSAYMGTSLEGKSSHLFEKYPKKMDAQIRSKIIKSKISVEKLDFYKSNFKKLIKSNLKDINEIKDNWFKKN